MDKHELQVVIEELHRRYKDLRDGRARLVHPDALRVFGRAGVRSGRLRPAIHHPVDFQALHVGLAIEAYGHDRVSHHVGVEPSGDAFNAIELQSGTNRPFNRWSTPAPLRSRRCCTRTTGTRRSTSSSVGSATAGDSSTSTSRCSNPSGGPATGIARLLTCSSTSGWCTSRPLMRSTCYFRQCSILVTCRDRGDGCHAVEHGPQPVHGRHGLRPEVDAGDARDHVHLAACTIFGRVGVQTGACPPKSGVAGGGWPW